jgi:transcriptional regulator with XRE-family HTH domain
MKKTKKPINYLRSHRQRWRFSQGELARLLGLDSPGVISRIEQKKRLPTLSLMLACVILFGTSAVEMFPDLAEGVETTVMERIWEMYEEIQGDPSKKTKKKIELLESAIARAKLRAPAIVS